MVGGWTTDGLEGRAVERDGALFLKHDLREPLPITPGTVKYIYVSHVIEHLHPRDGFDLLARCRSYMRDGGLIRLAYPDLGIFVERYVRRDRLFLEQRRQYIADFVGRPLSADAHAVSEIFYNWEHRWMYDHDSLAEVLTLAGFSEIRRTKLHETEMPDIVSVELERRAYHSGYLEAWRRDDLYSL
jgi:predicted SAM-dependent methyltransferase